MTTLKTLLIDDERLAREELKLLLNQFDEIDIIAEAADTEVLLQPFSSISTERYAPKA